MTSAAVELDPKCVVMCATGHFPYLCLRAARRLGVLLAPLRPWSTHVVQLGPVGIEQRSGQPAPTPASRIDAVRGRMSREQDGSDIGTRNRAHDRLLCVT